MLIVNIHEAKTRLSQLLAEVEEHHEIVRIYRNGKPIAEIVPIQRTINPLKQHDKIKDVKILSDLTTPLTVEEWPKSIKEFNGFKNINAFESYRNKLVHPEEDPFL